MFYNIFMYLEYNNKLINTDLARTLELKGRTIIIKFDLNHFTTLDFSTEEDAARAFENISVKLN